MTDREHEYHFLLGLTCWHGYLAAAPGGGRRHLLGAVNEFIICFRLADRVASPPPDHLVEASRSVAAELQTTVPGSSDKVLLSAAIALGQSIAAALPAGTGDRSAGLAFLAFALVTRSELTGSAADLDAAVRAVRDAVVTVPVDAATAEVLVEVWRSTSERSDRTGARADLDATIEIGRLAVSSAPADHPALALRRGHLGTALGRRFELDGERGDGDAAIDLLQQASAGVPAGHPARAVLLAHLGIALRNRANFMGVLSDADAAVETLREAVHITPADDQFLAARLTSLAEAWAVRFERSLAISDLDTSIEAHRKAVAVAIATPGHPEQCTCLVGLASTLLVRYDHLGARADLIAAIDAGTAAMDAAPADHPERPVILLELGRALRARFETVEAPGDLDTAVDLLQEAVAAKTAKHVNRPIALASLSVALRLRYERDGKQADIDAALAAIEAAVHETAATHPHRASRLAEWGTTLSSLADHTRAATDIDKAIEALRRARAAFTDGDPDRTTCLSNLGAALMARFQRHRDPADGDAAIEILEEAVAATPIDHPHRATRLSNLGGALWLRFEDVGAQDDLDAAISWYEAAAEALPQDHSGRSALLTNLSGVLGRRFDRAHVRADGDRAVATASAAVEACTGGLFRAWCLSNLGYVLRSRFDHFDDPGDLDAAIDAQREAVATTPPGHPNRAKYLNNLAHGLIARGARNGNATDVEEAVEAARAAVAATPDDHPNQAIRRSTLGHALHTRFLMHANATDRSDAADQYERAAGVVGAAPSNRISAARAAATIVAPSEPGRAAQLLRRAVLWLPEVAPRHLDRTDQEHALGGFVQLTADAAALSLADPAVPEPECATVAVGLLELGRAVLISQELDVRSDLTELAASHPGLAERFVALRALLDRPTDAAIGPTGRRPIDPETAADLAVPDRRRLAGELADLLVEIRTLDGFASFALPPSGDELLRQSAEGPVVVFNVSRYRSDALVLTAGGIDHVPLPGLEYQKVVEQIDTFRRALHAGLTATGSGDPTIAQAQLAEILAWLWDHAIEPIRDRLTKHRTGEAGQGRPRVWWIPGGLLSRLPLHAAGHHDSRENTVMDLVVSSYTPTIRSLRHAREKDARRGAPSGSALIVAMPTTPGGPSDLPYALEEARRIRAHLPDSTLLAEPAPDDDHTRALPTLAGVLELLPRCPIVHFACHGTSHPLSPSRSHLLLHDHQTHPLTVSSLTAVHLDAAQLAYLSACDTALTANGRLLDESIHLMSAFQLAGYPQVIGTLWSISDRLSAHVADSFYAAITSPVLDISRAAHALDHVIRQVRDRFPRSPSLWAAYIHTGA